MAFPNTAYFLPIIYSMLGIKVKSWETWETPGVPASSFRPTSRMTHLPYLGPCLDAGMAPLPDEMCEAIRYLNEPNFYPKTEDPTAAGRSGWARPTTPSSESAASSSWTAPPRALRPSWALPPIRNGQEDRRGIPEEELYVFMAANQNGTTLAQQLVQDEVQIGWNTRLVPFGPDISAAVFALGFANRAAMAFGGINPATTEAI